MIIKRWDNFIVENVQRAKSFIAKKLETWEKLKEMLKSNPGYIGKFTEYLFDDKISLEDLEITYKNLLDLKRKGKTIDIEEYNYEGLTDRIIKEQNSVKVNSVISQFPSIQKALIRELLKINPGNATLKLLKLSEKENLNIFISKISRYKTTADLSNAIDIFLKSIDNEKSTIISKVEKLEASEVVVDRENILIVRVGRFENLEPLASDCAWCILSKSNWSSYTNKRKQFIFFDFNKDELDPSFKIGITLNSDGSVYAAHDMLDRNVSSSIKDYLLSLGVDLKKDVLFADNDKKIDLSKIKITGSISNTSLNQLLNSVKIESVKEILNRLIGKSIKVKSNFSTIRQWIEIYMESVGNKFYTKEELEKEFPGFFDWYLYENNHDYENRNYIQSNRLDFSNFDKFLKGLNYWSDDVLLNSSYHYYKQGLIYFMNKIEEDKNIFNLVYDRLFRIDINKIKNIKTDRYNRIPGIYYFYLGLLWVKEKKSMLTRKEKDILNHITEGADDYLKSDFREKFGYGINLNYYFPKTKDEIKEIIKGDYSIRVVKELELLYDILEYLNGYNIKVSIGSDALSRYTVLNNELVNYSKNGVRSEVREMAKNILSGKRFKLFTAHFSKLN
jgi:hypothetical protein